MLLAKIKLDEKINFLQVGAPLSNKNLMVYNNSICSKYLIEQNIPNKVHKALTFPRSNTKTVSKSFFARYYYVGLGYKLFIYQNKLFIWVGLTHYTLLPIPQTVSVFCKKRRIYIVGSNQQVFKNFLSKIRKVRKKDIYKGKGLLEVKTYKGFIRMKTGKKKQY